MAREPLARKLISPFMSEQLSNITIISECIRQTSLFQPWAATFEAAMADKDTASELKADKDKMTAKLSPPFSFKLSAQTCALGAQVASSKYHVDKWPSKVNINAMRDAGRALDFLGGAAVG